MANLDHIVTINIPFETAKQAKIARDTISVDPVLKKDEISVDFSTEGAALIARFAGVSDRVIRVAVSNSIDNIKTIIETIDEFDGEKETIFQK
ncbi:hypothetical protein JCM33374_g6328 [Metschnikowia sp. JCM 33374]|nr:hypothetical protein JCM33374_g6328 [Metschnikowia sp. JCM 33374]